MRVELQPAYVLHARDYRDTSLIVDLITPDYGRLAVVARGARGRKGKSGVKQLLAPFQPLLISFQGKGDLKTMTAVEPAATTRFLTGKLLYSALYLNELMIRLLLPMDSHPVLYDAYQKTINILADKSSNEVDLEPVLRQFELSLLEELGYGLCFDVDVETSLAIEGQSLYCYIPESGFICCDEPVNGQYQGLVIKGEVLQAIAELDFSNIEVRRAAKQLTRLALTPLLGNKPLKSRELFRTPAAEVNK